MTSMANSSNVSSQRRMAQETRKANGEWRKRSRMGDDGAGVVGLGDEDAGAGVATCSEHCGADRFRLAFGHAADRRTAAAEEAAEGAGIFARGDDVAQKRNQLPLAVRLVQ